MNKKVALSILSATVVASMASSAFAAPKSGVYLGGDVDRYYELRDLFNLTDAGKTKFAADMSVTSFDKLIYVDFDGKGASLREIMNGEFSKVKRDLKESDFEGVYTKSNLDGSNGATYDPRKDAVPGPTGDLKIESVNAVNSAQLKVEFSKAVDAASVIDTDGTLKNGVITVSRVSGSGSVTVGDTSLASLSEDGKTLTITAATGAFKDLKFVVTVAENIIKDKDGKFLPAFTSNVLDHTDNVQPTVASVTQLNSSKVRVNFSEPLSNEGSWTFKFADGTAATVVVDPASKAKGYVDLTIDAGVNAGKAITATVIGARDFAGNLVNPNPLTLTITKGQLDGTKPTVQSITALGLNKFEIKFSEEVQGFEPTDVTIDGASLTSGKVTQDATDKTKYVVEFAAISADIHTVALVADAVTDLSGEKSNAYTKVVDFKADTTAPQLVSSLIKKDAAGFEYLHVVFNEEVSVNAASALATTSVKDFVTTTGTINLSGLTPVDTTNKEFKVKLSEVTFTPASGSAAALATGASYSVAFNGAVKDTSDNTLGTATISFTRGSDALTAVQEVGAVSAVENKPSEVKVTFKQDVDGATATNAANYNISGVVVEKAEVRASDSKSVYLTLQADSNTLSGARSVTVSGVKTKDGVAMSTPFSGSVDLVENVAPTFTAQLTGKDQLVLTFSEDMNATTLEDGGDFELWIGGSKVADNQGISTVAGTKATYTVTKATYFTADDLAKEIQIKVVPATNAVDLNNNKVKGTTVVVGK